MVNFIFHSDNGSWNSTKKRYEFSLTNRIDRPKIFKLQQASLIPSSAPSYPHVVYLKSENWLEPMYNKGFFSPKSIKDEELWNQEEYLIFVAKNIKSHISLSKSS